MNEVYLFEDEKAKYCGWAFTIKKLGNASVQPSDYAEIVGRLSSFGYVDCHYYEKDSLGKFHVHGIINLRKGFFRKHLKFMGFHLKLVELYDRQGWERYIKKDQVVPIPIPPIKQDLKNEFCSDVIFDKDFTV